ncbi:MAG: TorF family putative porin [Pseudomonadota bacterium]
MRRRIAAALTALSTLAAAPALAQEEIAVDFNLGVASEYVFRGVSQTDEDPQVFGGADLTAGMFYAGFWASNVDFGDSTDAEFDLYAGVTPIVGLFELDLGVLYYGYIDAPSGADYDYFEFQALASVPVGPATVGAGVWFVPDSYSGIDHSAYFEMNASYSPTTRVSLSGALGRQTFDGPGDYTTWNVGAAFALTDNLAVDLRYHDTDEHRFGKLYDSRVVVSLQADF